MLRPEAWRLFPGAGGGGASPVAAPGSRPGLAHFSAARRSPTLAPAGSSQAPSADLPLVLHKHGAAGLGL